MAYYIAVKTRGSRTWRVIDEEDRLCYVNSNRAKAEGVVEFLQDSRTPHWEGTKAWIEGNASKKKPRGWPA